METFQKTSPSSTPDSLETTERWFILILTLWGLTVTIAGFYGIFANLNLRFIPPIVMISLLIPVFIYYRNQNLRSYIWSLDLKHLTIFHVWRIVAAIVFFEYLNQNLLPRQFVFDAGYGDLIVGLLVPVVLLLSYGDRKYFFFNIFSLLDFVVAVGTGLTFTILQVPLMENIATYPIVLIPLYGVPVTGALSIMTLDRMLKKD
jgi:hypothetical protein